MTNITFADVVHQSIQFASDQPDERLLLELIDNPWVQRLRDICQTANTRLVYMFSEHSRFGHSLGVAYLAKIVLQNLAKDYPQQVQKYALPVLAASLLHDLGHLAPGSHLAYKVWFPEQADKHERIACKIIKEDRALRETLEKSAPGLVDTICRIICEDSSLPAWTWQVISGGGWNVDRGNWCVVDSVFAGVSYGKYNIPALVESIVITDSGELAVRENRLDALMHFAVSRHAMYRQVYQHRVLMASDTLMQAVVQRARDIGAGKLNFCDSIMQSALAAKDAEELALDAIFWMRESWWRYHLNQWTLGGDKILADLSRRMINRDLFKTVRIRQGEDESQLKSAALAALKQCGLDPRYYLHKIEVSNRQAGDQKQSMRILSDRNESFSFAQAEPLFAALVDENRIKKNAWFAVPKEVKELLKRDR